MSPKTRLVNKIRSVARLIWMLAGILTIVSIAVWLILLVFHRGPATVSVMSHHSYQWVMFWLSTCAGIAVAVFVGFGVYPVIRDRSIPIRNWAASDSWLLIPRLLGLISAATFVGGIFGAVLFVISGYGVSQVGYEPWQLAEARNALLTPVGLDGALATTIWIFMGVVGILFLVIRSNRTFA